MSSDLQPLLAELRPVLLPEPFVFVTRRGAAYSDAVSFAPLASFVEAEGIPLILPQARADAHDLAYEQAYRCITLQVHSSLTAVGLTAAVATRLAEVGIPANVVAAFHHDHVFVPEAQAREALAALDALSAEARGG